MEFLKKHYEKMLLGLVLVGLAATVVVLLFKVTSDAQELEDKRNKLLKPRVQELSNLDLTLPEAALKRLASPTLVDLSQPNRLFNPMPWQRTVDGRLIPATQVGPSALTVTNITPLYLILTLDKLDESPDGPPRFTIGIEKQAAPTPGQRSKKQAYCKVGEKDRENTFQVLELKGKPEDRQLVVELLDTHDKAVLTTNAPFRRVDGYLADFRYEPEKKRWDRRRINSLPLLAFNGEEYNIVAINENEAVLSAKSNGKKWTIKSSPSAGP